ncbi:uncharacterized protein MELLADRAFT_123964 [Melampsora larici-populina 98AG31]|uniref:Secreted protein n=1 Tax=Melampsora larici-populina (strain 98AG31 / pathotype 3-4-7) TaxID=747676 RepID=F4S230_MELLP|nr:uncharacterized protein MELLADRAFT_123964 [Melampsora larici-populina 98AG31]EGG01291.1 secreted protein [Melampsora larici-populina 98AG31]
MKKFVSLIVLSQFFTSGQANADGRVSVRSFVSEESHQPTILEKRQTANMTCYISTKYKSSAGNAADCFAAIDYLYSAPAPRPGCVICRTCTVKPLDGSENPVGGINGGLLYRNAPSIAQDSINAAYNYRFTQTVVSPTQPDCVNYVIPAGTSLGPLPPAGTFWAPFLLGYLDGQGDNPQACSAELDKEIQAHGG